MDNKSISSDLIRGHIDTIILYSLSDSDKCAQQISDSVELKSEKKYQINQATLYSSLKRLENSKYVSAYWHDSEAGRRRFFKLTELGNEVVKSNLNNWAYSKAIIDKLMDCEPEPVVKTQIIEKKIFVESPIQQKSLENTQNLVDSTPILSFNSQEKNIESQQKPTENAYKITENTQETNFRQILNGLIKTTEKNVKIENTAIVQEEVVVEPEVKKFNETINSDDLVIKNTANNNKIYFEDLVEKAENEGYKLKISSNTREIKTGTLFINKIKFIASLAVYLLSLIEFLTITLLAKTILNPSDLAVILILCGLTVFPVAYSIAYFKSPKKTSSAIKKDSILTVGIIIFNLILLVVVMNLLCNVDFNDSKSLILAFIIPVIACIDVFVYYVFKYIVANKKRVQKSN